MGRIGAVQVIATALLAMTAGCAGLGGDPAPPKPSGTPRVEPVWTSCPAEAAGSGQPLSSGNDAARLPRLDDSFHPVAAIVCSPSVLRRPGGGQAAITTERRADDVTALVAALKLSEQPPGDGPCTTELYLMPWLALLDEQGRWVRPRVPVGPCGKIRIEVRDAVAGLRLHRVTAEPAQPSGSAEADAAAAGCSRQWADLVWASAMMGTSSEPVVLPPGFDGPVRVRLCLYQVPADQQGTGKPAGDFRSGRYLSAEQWTAVRREFEAAAPAPACTTPASRFAVLHFEAGQLYAELDGCHRLLAPAATGEQTLRAATPTLLTLLAGR